MYFVSFTAPRVVCFPDPRVFERRAKRWLTTREGENNYLLGLLPDMIAFPKPGEHCFTVEEEGVIVAAGVVSNTCLVMSWASHEAMEAIAEYACNAGWLIAHVCAPADVSHYMANAYAARTHQAVEVGRGERIYQLTRASYAVPTHGRLEIARPTDRTFLREWMAGFIEDTAYELGGRTIDTLLDTLIPQRLLYLWKSPEPVAMAAWVSPTPFGATLNFVYTPPEFRGQGYGKAVSAALGTQMLASGLRYCFILTDVNDIRSNGLYLSIGARTLCEYLRCSIRPNPLPAQPVAAQRGLRA